MACYAVCPFGAINITPDELDELHPEIDADKCRQCGGCASVCPVINPPPAHFPQAAYALYTKDHYDCCTCASGGAATVFSRAVIEEGGAVFGCGNDKSGMPSLKKITASHKIDELKGSKYVYPDSGKIYREVLGELNTGRNCLFIGLPCHVAGLLACTRGKKYENLTTVDLICHGAPPRKYLEKHIVSVVPKSRSISRVTFRGKRDYFLTVYDKNNRALYSRRQDEDSYFQPFMKGLIFRSICYSCAHARPERISDITIGDFWGISPGALNGYEGKKSLVLINTDKGASLFASSIGKTVFEQRPIEEAIAGNAQLKAPSRPHPEREIFCRHYIQHHNFTSAVAATSIIRLLRRNRIRNILLAIPRKIKHRIVKPLKNKFPLLHPKA